MISIRISGDLVTLWDRKWENMKGHKFFSGIFLSVHLCGIEERAHILILYVPYNGRSPFLLGSPYILKIASLIIA